MVHDSDEQTGEEHRRGRGGARSETRGLEKLHYRPMGI